MDTNKHVKGYLAFAAVISVTYGAWQVFEGYNADSLELKQIESKLIETEKELTATNLAVRRDAAAKILEINARARHHYEELKQDGDLRPAEQNRLNYLEDAVPQQQAEVDKLEERLQDLEASE
jgi:D-alanyl-D-alanine dipeptidase